MHFERIHIVGQGLAGTLLAFQLEKVGLPFHISDDGHASSSSMVAAGMWNPVSFKKFSFSWNAPVLIAEASTMYEELEHKLGVKFFHTVDLVRIFADQKEAKLWDEKSDNVEMEKYLSSKQDTNVGQRFVAPAGHGVVQQAGWLDIPTFLEASKKYFIANQKLSIHSVDTSNLDDTAELTVVCTGFKATESKNFAQLPIRPNKGQVLTLKSEDLGQTTMVNFGKFIVPLGNNQYRLGATYEFNDPNPLPTESTRDELLAAWHKTVQTPCEVVGHKAGYRPTVSDRKPIIGVLPQEPSMAIFGGFGSKGVMLIPRYARQFAEHLLSGSAVDAEVRLERFL